MSSRIEALASRVRSDPFFLASALEDYMRSEGLDEPGLAAALGCSPEALPLLRLCRRPDPLAFRRNVERIAARFGADAGALARAVRRSDALAALRGEAAGPGTMMAARDGHEPRDEPEAPG